MITQTLTPQALAIIKKYLSIPINGETFAVPYFNNKRTKVRAGLRVTIGKGSPADIIEELDLLCLQKHVDKTTLTAVQAKQLLVENNIGIDCSGFVYYILDAQSRAKHNDSLKKRIHFPKTFNVVRNFIRRWRVIENINVELLASDANSILVALSDVMPGDMIVIMDAGYAGTVDHIMVVESTERENDTLQTINLIHSFSWSSDGVSNHGVRRAQITVSNVNKSLLEQAWIEQGKTGKENETLKRAKEAKRVEIRRLR